MHPLVARLTQELGWPLIGTSDALADWAALPGSHCLFLTGDAERNLETADVAVILPELRMTFQGAFDCAVAAPDFEEAVKEATKVFKTPALVFFRDGRMLDALPRVRDWSEYMARIPQILSTEPA